MLSVSAKHDMENTGLVEDFLRNVEAISVSSKGKTADWTKKRGKSIVLILNSTQ